jgi:hypothetical protein
MEKELKEIIMEIVQSLQKAGRKDAVVKWRYPEIPGYLIELSILAEEAE